MKKIALIFVAALSGTFATMAAQQVRRVMRPPATVSPHGRAARSTAQAAVAHDQPPPTVLPSFTATGLDGKPVTADSLSRADHWLLLYTRNGCEPCQKLLVTLGNSPSTSLRRGAPYVIVVAKSGVYGTLDSTRAKYPMLADATWLEDTAGSAVGALKPTGAPVLYAMRGKRVAWTVPGALDNPVTVEKLARSWMEGQDAAAAAQQSPTAATPTISSPGPM